MKILFLGDSHGHIDEMLATISYSQEFVAADAYIQVGDFEAKESLFKEMLENKVKFDKPLYFIDGNHEDHSFLNYLRRNKHLQKGYLDRHNIIYIPRGSVFDFGSKKFGFLGGTYNVEKEQTGREAHGDTCFITWMQLQHAITSFNETPLDVLVTHSCPHSIGVGMPGNPVWLGAVAMHVEKAYGKSLGPIDDVGDPELSILWANLKIKPRHSFYGHYHAYRSSRVSQTMFHCVGTSDYSRGSLPDDKLYFVYNTDSDLTEVYNAKSRS